jgi:hypothetical protein
MICLRIFRSYVTVTTACEKLQNWALCSVLWAFVQGGVIIVPHLLWHWTSVIPVLSEFKNQPMHSPLRTCEGMMWNYSYPDPKEFQLGICRDENFSRSKAEIHYLKDYGLSYSWVSQKGFWTFVGISLQTCATESMKMVRTKYSNFAIYAKWMQFSWIV